MAEARGVVYTELQAAFEVFTGATSVLEQQYRALQTHVQALRAELEAKVVRALETVGYYEPAARPTEVLGTEGDTIITQDLFVYEMDGGEDENGKIKGKHKSTGIARPAFWDRARYYGREEELATALDSAAD